MCPELSEVSQSQKGRCCKRKAPGEVNSQTPGGEWRLPGARGGERELPFSGTGFQFCKEEKVPERDGGDGCASA